MRIELLRDMVGVHSLGSVGTVVDVPIARGVNLICGGFAKEVSLSPLPEPEATEDDEKNS